MSDEETMAHPTWWHFSQLNAAKSAASMNRVAVTALTFGTATSICAIVISCINAGDDGRSVFWAALGRIVLVIVSTFFSLGIFDEYRKLDFSKRRPLWFFLGLLSPLYAVGLLIDMATYLYDRQFERVLDDPRADFLEAYALAKEAFEAHKQQFKNSTAQHFIGTLTDAEFAPLEAAHESHKARFNTVGTALARSLEQKELGTISRDARLEAMKTRELSDRTDDALNGVTAAIATARELGQL